MIGRVLLGGLVCASLGGCAKPAPANNAELATADETAFTTGLATQTHPGLIDCGRGSRVSAVGSIVAEDGTIWTVPAATSFTSGPKATDLFNECGGTMLSSVAELDLASVPLRDAGGTEEFVAYVFADNYFELYVNGTLVAVDPVPFTPFNSNVVRFSASRPVTIAIMLVDWEEQLGLGSEANRGTDFHPGDGGIVAHFQDAAGKTVLLTNGDWRAQTFYTAPFKDRACLVVSGQQRSSAACDARGVDGAIGSSAAHWATPDNWMTAAFDDSAWPAASVYTNEVVGVDNKRAYTNFTDLFDTPGADAEFIWSSNLILDNLVLLRTTIR